MDALAAKQSCRDEARERIRRLTPVERRRQSEAVRERILASPEWRQSESTLLFVPRADELDLFPLVELGLALGKTVGLPAFEPRMGSYVVRVVEDPARELVPGRFQIPEPGPNCRILGVTKLDYSLVPGLAFDVRGSRLGRGKGFYDRLLNGASGWRCGIGFDEQIFPSVPTEAHDLRMHRVLTAAQSYDCEFQN